MDGSQEAENVYQPPADRVTVHVKGTGALEGLTEVFPGVVEAKEKMKQFFEDLSPEEKASLVDQLKGARTQEDVAAILMAASEAHTTNAALEEARNMQYEGPTASASLNARLKKYSSRANSTK